MPIDSEGALHSRIVTTASSNIEDIVEQAAVEIFLEGERADSYFYTVFLPDRKLVVPNVRYWGGDEKTLDRPNGWFEIESLTEECFVLVPRSSVAGFPAGGAVNVAFDLMAGSIPDVGVVCGIGKGKRSDRIARWLRSSKVPAFFVDAEGTCETLNLRSGKSIVLCRKRPIKRQSPEVLAMLRSADPQVLVSISVKPSDLEVVEALNESQARFRVFVPHNSLLESRLWAPAIERLTAKADIVVMNEHEAATFRHLSMRSIFCASWTIWYSVRVHFWS